MKILDATAVIAIFNEINYPDLIDKILELGHELAIPSYVMKRELLDESTVRITRKFIKQGKIQILDENPIAEIRKFQRDFPGLGPGECDSMLANQSCNGSFCSILQMDLTLV